MSGAEDPGPVLVADSVGRSFGSLQVLKSATLWARRGEITVLLGRNGSGKTTLLRVAAGWLAPDHGAVRFRGRVLPRARLHRLAREGLFFLPQEGLLPRGRSIREVARTVMKAFPEARRGGDTGPGHDARDPEARMARWAERWELTSLLDATDATLSGGEKNRAGVALAVLRRPVCLLTDEPLTASAPKDRDRICETLRTLRDRGCAVVVTGHEARELLALGDRVIWMVAGTTRDLGRTGAALASHQFRREYLGPSFPPPEAGRAQASGAGRPTPRSGADPS